MTADALARDLDAAADQLADLHGTHQRAGEIIERAVDQRVPHGRTRRLAGSVSVEVGEQGVTVGAGGPGVEYVWPVHDGVPGRTAAHPFMSEALASTEDNVLDLYLDRVDDALDLLKGS